MTSSDAVEVACPVCSHPLQFWDRERHRRVYHADCRICGEFAITREAQDSLRTGWAKDRRHLLSGVLRNATTRGVKLEVTTANIEDLLNAARTWRTPLGILDQILLDIADRTTSFSDTVPIEWTEYSRYYLPRRQELDYLLEQLLRLDRLSKFDGDESIRLVRLSLDGWRRVEELAAQRRRSKQAFVAMWFDSSLNSVYTDAIQSALTETGFDAVRVDALEHNDKIDDRIVSEIRRSGLLVADFTGHRAGVYFEAGLAMGLGIPVIWCCREDCIDDVHFDTRQYNHIVWRDANDLHGKLTARIRATVSGATLEDRGAGT